MATTSCPTSSTQLLRQAPALLPTQALRPPILLLKLALPGFHTLLDPILMRSTVHTSSLLLLLPMARILLKVRDGQPLLCVPTPCLKLLKRTT